MRRWKRFACACHSWTRYAKRRPDPHEKGVVLHREIRRRTHRSRDQHDPTKKLPRPRGSEATSQQRTRGRPQRQLQGEQSQQSRPTGQSRIRSPIKQPTTTYGTSGRERRFPDEVPGKRLYPLSGQKAPFHKGLLCDLSTQSNPREHQNILRDAGGQICEGGKGNRGRGGFTKYRGNSRGKQYNNFSRRGKFYRNNKRQGQATQNQQPQMLPQPQSTQAGQAAQER